MPAISSTVPAPLRRLAALFTVAFAAVVLQGCAASTKLVTNDEASPEIKARSFSTYKEIILLPPKEDKREVVPKVVAGLESMGLKVTVADPEKPIEGAQGTAFLISTEGHLLTCAHVLGDTKEATVYLEGQRYFADVVKADKDADLALLKTRARVATPPASVLGFRSATRDYQMGEDVFTIGYPLSQVLGNSARMTKGLLSATKGLRDDPKQVQVSAEIQPGNSGGPLLDREGQVIGVVQKTINPWRVAQSTGGALPQNINFSIKNEPILAFIKAAAPELHNRLLVDKPIGLEKASHAVARVQAGLIQDETDRRQKMVVRFNYVAIWDLWWRFRYFALTAYDFETQEFLFAAGQPRDNMVSNEEVVIRDTLDQFRKALQSR